jgi:predicted ATPase
MIGHQHYDTQQYMETLRRANEKFVADRAQQEQRFNNWLANCKAWPAEVKATLPVDVDTLDVHTLIPGWYNENAKPDEVRQQVANANQIIEQINDKVWEQVEKGLQLYESYKQLG